MLKMHQKVLLLIAIATAIISCKKDLQPEPTSGLPPDAQVLKSWFIAASTSNFSEHYLNNPDTIPVSGRPDWEAMQKIGNVSLIPVASDILSQNDEQEVKKYLAIITNVLGKPENGYYLYVINKAGASSVTTNELVDYINGLPLKDFEGTIIKYDINNKYVGSLFKNEKSTVNQKDNLFAKPKESENTVASLAPLPEGCTYIQIDWYWQHFENGILMFEVYLYSTTEIDCGGGGGGGPHYDSTPPPHNPCAGADSLANNTEFKDKFMILKSKTVTNKESGYYYNNTTANNINEEEVEGIPDSLALGAPQSLTVFDGFIHSHFNLPGRSLSIFSKSDFKEIIDLYISGKMTDPLTFSAGLVTADTTQYMLRIDDIAKFETLVNNLTSPVANSFWKFYTDRINANFTKEQNEKGLLLFIQAMGGGISLFKGNVNFTNWQRKKLDENNKIADAPCI